MTLWTQTSESCCNYKANRCPPTLTSGGAPFTGKTVRRTTSSNKVCCGLRLGAWGLRGTKGTFPSLRSRGSTLEAQAFVFLEKRVLLHSVISLMYLSKEGRKRHSSTNGRSSRCFLHRSCANQHLSQRIPCIRMKRRLTLEFWQSVPTKPHAIE